MAKFTVFFNDKAIQSKIFDTGFIHIGRDESNDLTIDNLAIAPAHAVVTVKKDQYIIKQLNPDYPIYLNNEEIEQAVIQLHDELKIGKHIIIMTETEFVLTSPSKPISNAHIASLNNKLDEEKIPKKAKLQVLSGPHIGRLLPLKKSMTRLGLGGSGTVGISKRKEGYFIYSLEAGDKDVMVNQKPLTDKTILLENNDMLAINGISMQFFLEN